jgi:hypothetical protein
LGNLALLEGEPRIKQLQKAQTLTIPNAHVGALSGQSTPEPPALQFNKTNQSNASYAMLKVVPRLT